MSLSQLRYAIQVLLEYSVKIRDKLDKNKILRLNYLWVDGLWAIFL